MQLVRKTAMILPNEVLAAANTLHKKVGKDVYELDTPLEMLSMLINAEMDVYAAVRKSAGIGPLSKEMQRFFGQTGYRLSK